MSTQTSAAEGGPSNALAPLIEERALLKQWISRLDECAGTVPYHIAARVRSDYTERLGRVLDELRPHGDALWDQLDALADALGNAEAELTQATDRLEESRLRHLTGELELQSWSEQAPMLEEASAAAEAECARIRAELSQVRDLVREIDPTAEFAEDAEPTGMAAEAPAVTLGDPAPDDFATAADDTPRLSADEVFAEWSPAGAAPTEVADDEEDLPWLELLDAEPEPAPAADDFDGLDFLERLSVETEETPSGAAVEVEDDDFAFLQELDRALATSTTKPSPANRTTPSPAELLPCASCGGSNDPTAWYCEKCGEELA